MVIVSKALFRDGVAGSTSVQQIASVHRPNNSRFGGGSSLRLARKCKRTRIGLEGFFPQTEELIPGGGSPRQDHVPRLLIPADEYFLALESEFGGQAHGLASAILKELCGTWHKASC